MRSGSSSKTDQKLETKRSRIDGDITLSRSENRLEDASSPAAASRPLLSWDFFASLAIPGENSVYTLHDGKGRFLKATPGCEQLWGSTTEQLRKKSIVDFARNAEDLRRWLFRFSQDDPTEELFSLTLLDKPCPPFELNVKAIPLFISPEPEQTRIVIKAVPAKEGDRSKAFPQAQDLSSIHDFEGRFQSANASWSELIGLPLDTFQTIGLADLIIDADAERLRNFLEEVRHEDAPRACILRFKTEEGQIKSVLLTARKDAQNARIIADCKNMTVEGDNPAMDLLKTSVELVNESVLLLMKVGPGFRICYANRAFENMTGYSFSRVSGSSLSCLNGPKTNAKAILDLEAALRDEEEHTGSLLLYRKNGAPFWSNAYLFPLRDNTGTANYFAVILEDTSEVRAVSEELAAKNAELQNALKDLKETQKTIIQQESLRALGQMASGIAHDFNNLLAPILGFSELLLTVPEAAKDEKRLSSYLKKIQVAAQDGAAVVGRLREFYRSQNSPEEFIEIHPEELLWQVKELTRHRWKNQAEAKGVRIEFQMEMGSTRAIMGNEPELRQVFTNLIINAVDAMNHDGSITIRANNVDGRVCIEIEDTGCGMNEETRAKCLEPFYTTKGKLGTGLGLSIVFGVVKRHHGDFQIDSVEGQGTTIRMSFPALTDSPKSHRPRLMNRKSKSLRIMLVDDEDVLLEVVSELLASGGHIVDVFNDPNEAIKVMETSTYDLVITDRAMPLMSGDELAASIKALDPDIPIFMITGFGDLIKESGDIPEHIDEVLGKPVPLDVLNAKLCELAEKKAK